MEALVPTIIHLIPPLVKVFSHQLSPKFFSLIRNEHSIFSEMFHSNFTSQLAHCRILI